MALPQSQSPSRTVNYGSGSPDVVLVTSEPCPHRDVHFYVHRKNLESISIIFKDIFDTGAPNLDGQLPRLELTESSEVVQSLLAESRAYPVLIPRYELEFPKSWEVIKAAEKYQVTQALETIKAAFTLRMSRELPPNSEHDLQALVFALHCHFSDLEDTSLRRLLEEEPPVELVGCWIKTIEFHFPVDDRDRLLTLLRKHHERAQAIRSRLRQNLADSIAAWHRAPPPGKPVCSCPYIPAALHHWDNSRDYTSLHQLEQYVEKAKAELEGLSDCAAEGEGECVREAGRKLQELVTELKELSRKMGS